MIKHWKQIPSNELQTIVSQHEILQEKLDKCATDYDMLNADYIKLQEELDSFKNLLQKYMKETTNCSRKVENLQKNVSDLETALRDMISVAEFDQWDESLTGKRLILNAAKQLLETKENKT
jgi:chromosome segregation ATPase